MPHQLSLLDAGLARASDPQTAKDAALNVKPGSQYDRILRWLDRREMNRDSLSHWAKVRVDVVSSRVNELRKAGLVEETGRTQTGASGQPQTTYRLTETGRYFVKWRLGR